MARIYTQTVKITCDVCGKAATADDSTQITVTGKMAVDVHATPCAVNTTVAQLEALAKVPPL
jgi:hypothetical protein